MTDPKSSARRTTRTSCNTKRRNRQRDLSEKEGRLTEDVSYVSDTFSKVTALIRSTGRDIIDGIEEFFGSAEAEETKVVQITSLVFEKKAIDPEPWSPEHDAGFDPYYDPYYDPDYDPDYDVPVEVTYRRSQSPTRVRRSRRHTPSLAGLMTQRSAVPLS